MTNFKDAFKDASLMFYMCKCYLHIFYLNHAFMDISQR